MIPYDQHALLIVKTRACIYKQNTFNAVEWRLSIDTNRLYSRPCQCRSGFMPAPCIASAALSQASSSATTTLSLTSEGCQRKFRALRGGFRLAPQKRISCVQLLSKKVCHHGLLSVSDNSAFQSYGHRQTCHTHTHIRKKNNVHISSMTHGRTKWLSLVTRKAFELLLASFR